MGYPLVYITFIYLQLIQACYNFILYNNKRHAIVTMWRLLCIVHREWHSPSRHRHPGGSDLYIGK